MAVRPVSTPLETAVLIVPPFEVQAFAAALRPRDPPSRWTHVPAHITLLYPFAPPQAIDESLPRLRRALGRVRPFPVTLDRYGRFPTAVFLEPADPRPLVDLYGHLAAAFPEYPAYGGEFGPGLHPHLTLAHSEDGLGLHELALRPAPSFTFLVDRLAVYAGAPDASVPYVPLAVAHLGRAA
ncbi:MAG: 2'-5' RNA ligase family protein [Chloroflexi bacterium]|nr:2'-5' RNA ligase family protein [Chloroflexota bacterium]